MGSTLRSTYAVQVRPIIDVWQLWFRIDHQSFSLPFVSEIVAKSEAKHVRQWLDSVARKRHNPRRDVFVFSPGRRQWHVRVYSCGGPLHGYMWSVKAHAAEEARELRHALERLAKQGGRRVRWAP